MIEITSNSDVPKFPTRYSKINLSNLIDNF